MSIARHDGMKIEMFECTFIRSFISRGHFIINIFIKIIKNSSIRFNLPLITHREHISSARIVSMFILFYSNNSYLNIYKGNFV